MKNTTQISLSDAKQIALDHGISVSTPTLIQWIDDNRLGHQPGGAGGKWYVYKEDFIKFIKGE